MHFAFVVALALLVACKKAPPADPAAGSGSAPIVAAGSGSAPIVAAGSAGSAAGSGSAAAPTPGDAAADAPEIDATAAGDKANDVFGGIALGTKVADVVKKLGEPESKEDAQEEAATGLWVATWKWPKQGVELSMAADKQGVPPTVNSITLTDPATLKNPKGIGIGSSRADVEKAYGDAIDKAESREGSILVGSVYGGAFFDLEHGKVTRIFIGAGAE